MALTTVPVQIHKFPQDTYIDALRWLLHLSTFSCHVLLVAYDTDTPSLQALTFSPSETAPSLTSQASAPAPSRITSLKISPSSLNPSRALIASATFSGSLLFHTAYLINGSLDLEFSLPEMGFHSGAVSAIDLNENGSELKSLEEPIYLFGQFLKKPLECLTLGGFHRLLFISNARVPIVKFEGNFNISFYYLPQNAGDIARKYIKDTELLSFIDAEVN